MTISRVKVNIVNPVGGNAAMNVYFNTVDATRLSALGALITAAKVYLPTASTYTIPSSGDTLSEVTGILQGSWSAAAPAAITGTGGGVQSAPTGFFLDMKAGSVVDGHRPIAKMMFVPSAVNAYNTSGMVNAATVTAMNTAIGTYITAVGDAIVWHRPVYTGKAPNRVLSRPGSTVFITAGSCNTKPCVLRSRRD